MKTVTLAAAVLLIAAPAMAQSDATSTAGANKAGTTQDGTLEGNRGSSTGTVSHPLGAMSPHHTTSSSKKSHSTAMQDQIGGPSNGMSQSGNGQTGTQSTSTGR